MAFKPLETQQLSEPGLKILLTNNITVTIGDALAVVYAGNKTFGTNASGSVAGVGRRIAGIVAGFEDSFGQVLPLGNSSTNANQKSIATTTAGNIYARCYDPTPDMIFVADLSAASGTTSGSDQPFTYFNLTSATQIDETSVARAADPVAGAVTSNQVYSLGVNANNSSQLNVKFVCTDITQGTA